jgi:hypothetical protein
MDFLILLAVGLAVGIPVATIVALVRTASLRRSLEENYLEFRDRFTDLTGEITRLKREIAEVSRRVDRQDEVTLPAPAMKTGEPSSAPEPTVEPSQPVGSVTIPHYISVPPELLAHSPVVDRAAVIMPPPIVEKRVEPSQSHPQTEPV